MTTLREEHAYGPPTSDEISGQAHAATKTDIGESAARHGNALLQRGYSVDQVVHDYGDLCQAVTDLAVEKTAPLTANEFRTLNRCLDDAIAAAVTEFMGRRDEQHFHFGTIDAASSWGVQTITDRDAERRAIDVRASLHDYGFGRCAA